MSDVGDAVELSFESGPGATVTMDLVAPDGTVTKTAEPVPENPAGSGLYPIVFVGTSVGTWQARFTAVGAQTAVETFYQAFDDPTGPSPYASIGEYEDIYGTLSAVRQGICNHLLKRASQMIRDRYRDVDTRIATGVLPRNSVAMAVMNMTARVMRNPNGVRGENIGPFARTYDTEIASGLLQFTDAEVGLLLPVGSDGTAKIRVGTIRVKAGLAPYPYGWRHW
ncbi:MAG: hypothetical protein ABWY93_18880 [Mycobacterium sp.]